MSYKIAEDKHEWYIDNRDILNNNHRRYYANRRTRISEQRAATRQKLRQALLDMFGGVCAYCGFNDTRALHLDHIDGGGVIENKKMGNLAVYRKALGGAPGYQLLCANYNWIKRIENEEHKTRVNIE